MDDRITLIIIYILFLFTDRHLFFKIIYSCLLICNMYYLSKNKFDIKLKQWIILIFSYICAHYLIEDPNPFYYLLTFYLPLPNFFRAVFIIILNSYIFNKYIVILEIPQEQIIDNNKKEEKEIKEQNKDENMKEDNNKTEELEEENDKEKKEDKNKALVKTQDIKEVENKDEKKEENEDEKKEENKSSEEKKENIIKLYFLYNEIRYFWKNKDNLIWLFIWLIALRIAIYFYDIKYWIYVDYPEKLLYNSFSNNKNTTKSNRTMYYISAVIYNMEPIIKDWISEMKQLIDYLGRENVIVSIVENGDSTDKTRKYLNFFENYLINNKVINIIDTEKKEKKEGVDRIRFLAKLRNRSLDFLYLIGDLDFSNTKIIFFNDIIFRYEDIVKLIYTNNGNYDTVCAMDYYESFYDTWASIGLDGKQFRRYFPYFYNKEEQDAYINGEVIRTFSCWNGVNVITAKAFEDRNKLFFRTGRKIRQSECTLLHADMYWLGFRKVFVNTQVAVAYNYEYYYKNHYVYPWTKNLFTYFYYYFKYWFVKRNYNMTNLESNDITMDNNLDQVVKEYMGFDL